MVDGYNILGMKRFAYILVAVSALVLIGSCSKDKSLNIVGEWKLDDISVITKGETYDITVYLKFSEDDSFEIYQQLQEGRYQHYTGTYTLKGKTLKGQYLDGTVFGSDSYSVALSETSLKLTAVSGEVTTYVTASIPDSVKSNAVEK